jgi:hypothetical protein
MVQDSEPQATRGGVVFFWGVYALIVAALLTIVLGFKFVVGGWRALQRGLVAVDDVLDAPHRESDKDGAP